MSKYNTEQRRQLLNLFEESEHKTLSAQEILNELGENIISISAVYRNLAEMRKEGIVCKISEKNRQGTRYQYVSPKNCKGIVHLKCNDCDSTIHLNKNVSQLIFAMAKDEHGFEINNSSAFLYGQCDKCSNKIINGE